MPIVGSLPSDYESQQTYLATVNASMKNLESRSALVSVHSASEPSEATLNAQWASQLPYATPQTGSLLNWFDPTAQKVQQQYIPQMGSGGVLLPYKPKPTDSDFEFIDEVVIGTPAAALTKSTLTQNYRNIMVRWFGRSAAAGVGIDNVGLRLNGSVAATHDYSFLTMTSAGVPTGVTGAAATMMLLGSAPQSGAVGNIGLHGGGHFYIPNYSVSVSGLARRWMIARAYQFSTNTRPWTKTQQLIHLQSINTGPITSFTLVLLSGANFERGSRMVIYGMK